MKTASNFFCPICPKNLELSIPAPTFTPKTTKKRSMKKINTPYTKVGRLKSTELLIESANNTGLSGIYDRQPDPNTRLEDKIFPYSEKLQKIYEKICKNGNLSLNLLNELKQYANDTRRNIKGFPGLMRINDRTLVASALLR